MKEKTADFEFFVEEFPIEISENLKEILQTNFTIENLEVIDSAVKDYHLCYEQVLEESSLFIGLNKTMKTYENGPMLEFLKFVKSIVENNFAWTKKFFSQYTLSVEKWVTISKPEIKNSKPGNHRPGYANAYGNNYHRYANNNIIVKAKEDLITDPYKNESLKLCGEKLIEFAIYLQGSSASYDLVLKFKEIFLNKAEKFDDLTYVGDIITKLVEADIQQLLSLSRLIYRNICQRFSNHFNFGIYDWSFPTQNVTNEELRKFMASYSKTTSIYLSNQKNRINLAKEAKNLGLQSNLTEVSAKPVKTDRVKVEKIICSVIHEKKKLMFKDFKESYSFLVDASSVQTGKRKDIEACGDIGEMSVKKVRKDDAIILID